MQPMVIAKYLLLSLFFVFFLVSGFRLLFMDQIDLEDLRSRIKRRYYISFSKFNLLRKLFGLLFCLISVCAFALIVLDFIQD